LVKKLVKFSVVKIAPRPPHRTNYAVVLAARNAASNNGRGVHTHAARCCAALAKHKKRFYQRSSTTRGTAQKSSYPTFAVRTTLQQNVLQLAQMNGFNEEDIFGLSSRVVSASDCDVRGPKLKSRRGQLCLSRQLL